ncbi:MAG: flagellar export protein FliJ [Desulfohalobiaceae bacterium]
MAGDFQFSLQRVLEYREQLEDQARLAMSRDQQAHEIQQQEVAKLQSDLGRTHADLRNLKNPTVDEMWLYREYKERLLQDLAEATSRLEELAREVTLRRTELIECSKERKLLEKLKQTQAQDFAREQQSREQKTFDETATLRHQDRDT